MRKITILLLSSPAMSKVIEHLLRGKPDFEVVGSIGGLKSLGQHAGQVLPEVIVADVKPVSAGVCRTAASIKQASPASKLILICPVLDFARGARKCGADACLNDEKLVCRLLPVARALAHCKRRLGTVPGNHLS